MKVPRYIKDKMYSVVDHENKKHVLMTEIEDWLERHGIDTEELRDGSGAGLEELDYGHDIVELLCRRISGEEIL